MEGYVPHVTEEETEAHTEGKRGTFKEAKRTPSRDVPALRAEVTFM